MYLSFFFRFVLFSLCGLPAGFPFFFVDYHYLLVFLPNFSFVLLFNFLLSFWYMIDGIPLSLCLCSQWLIARWQFYLFTKFLVVWPRFGGPFLSENPWEVCTSLSPGRILGYAYNTYSHGQIKIILHKTHWIAFPIRSCLILYFLCYFKAFAHYMIDRFVSNTT